MCRLSLSREIVNVFAVNSSVQEEESVRRRQSAAKDVIQGRKLSRFEELLLM